MSIEKTDRYTGGSLSEQELAALDALEGDTPTAADFGGFCGKYGNQYKDFLEAYEPITFWDLVHSHTLKNICAAKNEEVHEFIENTIKALLVTSPGPDKSTQPLEWTQHQNALKVQAEELAEPLLFGGQQLGELGEPKLERPVYTHGRPKNMFFGGTQDEWENAPDRITDLPW